MPMHGFFLNLRTNNMKIFISVPVTGHDKENAREHADMVKASLSRQGHKVINPLTCYDGKNPDYFTHVCVGLQTLASCDAIYLCDGWRESRGCRVQHYFARCYGKTVLFESADISEMRIYDNKDTEYSNFYFNR